jgi:glycine hydroxymethyltransferase
MSTNLMNNDFELYQLINKEYNRQKGCIELIASENHTSKQVMECMGSILTNKYSEGQIGRRYYGGNQYIDEIEKLCKDRALKAFNLNNDWHVNVQAYSGSPANFAVYTALLKPGDRILGLDLSCGGHLTHGYKRLNKNGEYVNISASSIYFNTDSYIVNNDGFIDYDYLIEKVNEFKPHLIIVGASAYPRDFEYQVFRQCADSCGAILMGDISHISGFVATGYMNNAFQYCDVVTTTTHKTLRGPRSALIFCKKKYAKQIDNAVFPGLQGGPHNHQIAAVCTQLKEVKTPEFKKYVYNIQTNTNLLCKYLMEKGFNIMTNGSDNHILLIDLKNFGITGSKMEYVCDKVNISLNKNSIIGDTSPLSPSGIRIGLNTMTTRNINMDGLKMIAKWLFNCVELCIDYQNIFGKIIKNWNIDNDIYLLKLKEEIYNYAITLDYY